MNLSGLFGSTPDEIKNSPTSRMLEKSREMIVMNDLPFGSNSSNLISCWCSLSYSKNCSMTSIIELLSGIDSGLRTSWFVSAIRWTFKVLYRLYPLRRIFWTCGPFEECGFEYDWVNAYKRWSFFVSKSSFLRIFSMMDELKWFDENARRLWRSSL